MQLLNRGLARAGALALMAALAAIAAGCGGGGGGGSSKGRLGVFVTDSFRDDYDHVWTTIFKAELIDSNGAAQTVFDDAAGRVADLRSLRDATGERFLFLGQVLANAASHARVRLTVAPSMTLVPKGGTTGTSTPIADTVPKDGQGRPQITFNLSAPRNLGSGSDDLIVDFDLANFAILGGKIVPALKEGSKTGLGDRSRHEDEDYEGTVSGLSGTAPNFTFTLTMANGIAFAVETNSSTVVFNSNAAPNPTIANGKRVEVRGTFTPGTDRLLATEVKIEDQSGADDPEAYGDPKEIDAVNRTFHIFVRRAEGFVPANTTIRVVTTASTIYRASGGITLTADEFFTRLANAPRVEVEGSYDEASNTLTAKRAKLEDEDGGGGGGDAEAKGKAVNVNALNRSFDINPVSEWEGFPFAGGTLNVQMNAGAEYKDANNQGISETAFFNALAAANRVKVEGALVGGIFKARQAKLL